MGIIRPLKVKRLIGFAALGVGLVGVIFLGYALLSNHLEYREFLANQPPVMQEGESIESFCDRQEDFYVRKNNPELGFLFRLYCELPSMTWSIDGSGITFVQIFKDQISGNIYKEHSSNLQEEGKNEYERFLNKIQQVEGVVAVIILFEDKPLEFDEVVEFNGKNIVTRSWVDPSVSEKMQMEKEKNE